ncbi:MAG: hypothetical protein AAGL49_12845, partial [Pseudomonadota bacterium]
MTAMIEPNADVLQQGVSGLTRRLPNLVEIGTRSDYSNQVSRLFQRSQCIAERVGPRPTSIQFAMLGGIRLIRTYHGFDVDISCPAFFDRHILHVPVAGSFSVGRGT